MRQVREILRLKYEQRLPHRAIARACGVGLGTVAGYCRRAERAGLTWPLPADLDDAQLEARLFQRVGDLVGVPRPLPDMAWVHQELKRPGVTLQRLHLEYVAQHPAGYRYSQYCRHYHDWARTLAPTMRQVHRAGEKAFVDFSGVHVVWKWRRGPDSHAPLTHWSALAPGLVWGPSRLSFIDEVHAGGTACTLSQVTHPNPAKEKAIKARGEQLARTTLWRFAGVDLTRIDGISAGAAQVVLTEVGPQLVAFPSEDHFVSWLRLCPRTPISGGKPLRKRRNGLGANRIAGTLRMAATSLERSKTALGASFRRIARYKGGAVAVFATARQLARLIYRMLRYGHDYVDVGEKAYDQRFQIRRLAALTETAKSLGYTLVPNGAAG